MTDAREFTSEKAESFHWWFLLSWLGLDAPNVALTWTWAVSRHAESTLSFRPAAALFLVVWSIYLLDRLLDVARCNDWQHATGRLRFGHRYRWLFWTCSSLCTLGIVALLLAGLPTDLIRRAAYVSLGMSVHFFVFVVPIFSRSKPPGKEFSVGLFFAMGAYACLGYTTGMWPLLMAIVLLIAFNCLIIAAKDAECDLANDPGGASHWWRSMQRDLTWGGAVLTIIFGLTAVLSSDATFYLAIAMAFLCLTALHWYSHKFGGDAFRSLADFALFTPLLVEIAGALCYAGQ